MRKTKLTESDYIKFYKAMLYGNTEDYVNVAIRSAYRDLCRTIHGFSNNPNHDAIYKSCVDFLYLEINNILSQNIENQDEYDKWHKKTSDKLIELFKDQEFTYGQAQKWINMAMKYVSMFNHKAITNIYEYCHIPIDNYVLSVTKYYGFNVAWSKIKSYEDYIDFQICFRNKYKEIPLDEEFYLWINEAIKRR